MASLAQQLELTGRDLKGQSEKASSPWQPLRQLKETLPRYWSRNSTHVVRCLSFLLAILLDDIFYNLVGDFPQEKPYGASVHGFRESFRISVANSLEALAKTIAEDDVGHIFGEVELLVNNYLDCIDKINDEIERSRTKAEGQ